MRFLTQIHRPSYALLTVLFFAWINISSAQSALEKGTWAKVSISESGVYKISYDDLMSWGLPDNGNVSIYGNGAEVLPLLNGTEYPDTLHEISIQIEKGDDGILGKGDYILFYGQGPNSWSYNVDNNTYSYNGHPYCDKNYYFITTDRTATKIITTNQADLTSATTSISSYDNLQAYEKNETNVLSSGRTFYESISSNKTISFSIPNIIHGETANVNIVAAARHSSAATIGVYGNGELLGNIAFSATSSNSPYAIKKSVTYPMTQSSSPTSIALVLNYSGANSRGYLDYCTLESRCSLSMQGLDQLIFRDSKSITDNTIGQFSISSSNLYEVWDITEYESPMRMKTSFNDGKTSFLAHVDSLREYIAFQNSFKSVSFESIIDNQNILAHTDAEMIIVANDIFADYANKLAELHQTNDKIQTVVVSQEAICNEFSSGRNDVAAIRNYMRYLYKKGDAKLQYLLLFGNGHYNNHDVALNDTRIFTFETQESLNEDYSICSDDFFGILEDNHGVKTNDTFIGEMDIAVGRFPVNTTKEAEILVNKHINYETNPEYRGDWQNYLCFLADDANENQTMHMEDADQHCELISKIHPEYNFDKIYADAYTQIRSSAGERYPDVTKAIYERMQKGSLIFNYSGHGNESRMMAEYAVDASTIETWKNSTKLPFFVAAACNISHFDYDGISIGEKILTQKDGGGIGILSATRYSYASYNYTLCKNLYSVLFDLDANGNPITIGDALKDAKAKTSNDIYQNKRIYTLLGDPALRLAIPTHGITVDSINNQDASEFKDTIKASSKIHISGHISTPQGDRDSDFNGTLYIKLFDKKQSITTLGNDNNDLVTFDSYTNILFQGLAEVTNGEFSFTTIIPEDIYYYEGCGRLSLYATNDSIQATGIVNSLQINGSENSAIFDDNGPTVNVYCNDTLFTEGMITNENPTLLLLLSDESGINISNAAIGHDIVMIIDGDESNQIILNDFYYADLNTYTSGSIRYKMNGLSEGEHTLHIIVWDTQNNSTETELSFTVSNSTTVNIAKLYNYPNPMNNLTTFHIEHNQAEYEATITLRIYNREGRCIRIYQKTTTPGGFVDTGISWDGTDFGGSPMPSGVYPYTIEIKTDKGKRLCGEQKILLLR